MNFFKKLFGCKCKKCCPHKEGEVCNCQNKEKCCKEQASTETNQSVPVSGPTPTQEGNPQM